MYVAAVAVGCRLMNSSIIWWFISCAKLPHPIVIIWKVYWPRGRERCVLILLGCASNPHLACGKEDRCIIVSKAEVKPHKILWVSIQVCTKQGQKQASSRSWKATFASGHQGKAAPATCHCFLDSSHFQILKALVSYTGSAYQQPGSGWMKLPEPNNR